MSISRRGFLIGLPLLAAGCASTGADYGAINDGQHRVAAIPFEKMKSELRRTEVAYQTSHPKGTIVVNTPERRLYYVLGNGRAIRYGIGVGREGLALRGNAEIGRKAKWPSWTPTQNMMRRDPRNLQYAGGLPGGPNNPLGARALYLYRGGADTMFRIHGTNQPQSIGLAVSSGCVRMMNHDVIDLYERVSPGTRVVVMQA